jgi:thioredoxin-like negative regulator of GroEL
LDKLAGKAAGFWNYATLNCDTLPDIALSLKIENLPVVYYIEHGKSLKKFVGIPPEGEFNSFINFIK